VFRAKNQNRADMGSVAGALLKKVVGGDGEGKWDVQDGVAAMVGPAVR
jgi:hypothetical protein